MSISWADKITLIRESERLTRKEFCELTGIKYGTLSSYESGTKGMTVVMAEKMLQHPLFEKYTLWFMTGKTAPGAGQIEPALAHSGHEKTNYLHSEKKTG
ncbi:helix-turn-helix domain-containing protein [Aeromonas enteropelogenes]|uniref:helix-turn-helix domain-containing protein n=1 Tax=Aeromonas enteropelogenes TaxID=29489 RepID=UPI003BA3B553